ncbi:hypothetical protein VaNZ11_010888, partial [Volvox africanus]
GLGFLLTSCVLKAVADAKHEYATVMMHSTAPIVAHFWPMVGFRPHLGVSYGSGSNWEHLAAIMDGERCGSAASRRLIAPYGWLDYTSRRRARRERKRRAEPAGTWDQGFRGGGAVQERLSDSITVPFGCADQD